MKLIYLDHAATSPLSPEVLEEMLPVFSTHYGNPSSSTHGLGWYAAELVEIARRRVAQALGTPLDEAHPQNKIVFTSGATESNNLAIKGTLLRLLEKRLSPADIKVVSVATEHSSVLEPLEELSNFGFKVKIVPVNEEGQISNHDWLDIVSDNTDFISIMHVNNETGTIHHLEELLSLVPRRMQDDIPLPIIHCDATQSFGRIPLSLGSSGTQGFPEPLGDKASVIEKQAQQVGFSPGSKYGLGINLLSLSGHKVNGPKGVGALYINSPIMPQPLQTGGTQEYGLRPGTLNTPAIVGLGKAAQLAASNQPSTYRSLQTMSALFLQILDERKVKWQLNGSKTRRHPGIVNITFPGTSNQQLLGKVSSRLAISTQAACSSHTGKPSHVLTSMHLSPSRINSSVRISFGACNTLEEVRLAAEIIAQELE